MKSRRFVWRNLMINTRPSQINLFSLTIQIMNAIFKFERKKNKVKCNMAFDYYLYDTLMNLNVQFIVSLLNRIICHSFWRRQKSFNPNLFWTPHSICDDIIIMDDVFGMNSRKRVFLRRERIVQWAETPQNETIS